MDINLKLVGSYNSPICYENCVFSHECSNHESAGTHRFEDGFTPEITFEKGQFFCATRDRKSLQSGYPYIGEFPENYEKLGKGFLTWKKIKENSTINFSI